jgi:hypothetical protein
VGWGENLWAANYDLERIETDLRGIPTESDLETLEQLASNFVGSLGNNLDISPEVMKMLNLKVLILMEGELKLEGWFALESDGLLSPSII